MASISDLEHFRVHLVVLWHSDPGWCCARCLCLIIPTPRESILLCPPLYSPRIPPAVRGPRRSRRGVGRRRRRHQIRRGGGGRRHYPHKPQHHHHLGLNGELACAPPRVGGILLVPIQGAGEETRACENYASELRKKRVK